jgi:hypothetical protein
LTFDIGRTWDGVPVGDDERAVIDVRIDGDDLVLAVTAPFHGDPPPTGPAGSREALWEHEVVEWFIVGNDGKYLEIELGPHGHFLVLQLDGVRNAVARGLPIAYEAHIDGATWRGVARIPPAYVPVGPHRVNAFAIHGVGAGRRYLASTALPGAKPDFHQPDRFEAAVLA